jgi:O-antigen/teichoic acid export membrane protein
MQANMKIEFSLFSTVLWKLINLAWIAFIIYLIFGFDYFDWILTNNIWDNLPFVLIFIIATIGVFINTVLNYFYARKIVKFGFSFDWKYIKYIFKISLPYWIALFLSVIYFKIDIILLSIIEWPKLWDLSIALYSLPMKIVEVLMVVWWFYMTSILSSLTKAFREKQNDVLQNLINISFKILFSFSILVFSLWILFREYLIEIVANKNYLITTHMFNSSDAFLIVFAVIVFYFISLVFIYSLVASDNQNKLLKINIIVTIFNIVWNIILIPKYSFVWAWIVTLFSQILFMFLWYFYTQKLIKFNLPLLFIIKNILFWTMIYIIWFLILNNLSVWLYFDFIVYGGILFSIYSSFLFFSFKKI